MIEDYIGCVTCAELEVSLICLHDWNGKRNKTRSISAFSGLMSLNTDKVLDILPSKGERNLCIIAYSMEC